MPQLIYKFHIHRQYNGACSSSLISPMNTAAGNQKLQCAIYDTRSGKYIIMKKVEDKSDDNASLPQYDGEAGNSSSRPDKIPRIGRALRKNRKKSGLSLRTLAELSGVSVGMISGIERDISNPSLKTLTKLRHALDMPLNAFF